MILVRQHCRTYYKSSNSSMLHNLCLCRSSSRVTDLEDFKFVKITMYKTSSFRSIVAIVLHVTKRDFVLAQQNSARSCVDLIQELSQMRCTS